MSQKPDLDNFSYYSYYRFLEKRSITELILNLMSTVIHTGDRIQGASRPPKAIERSLAWRITSSRDSSVIWHSKKGFRSIRPKRCRRSPGCRLRKLSAQLVCMRRANRLLYASGSRLIPTPRQPARCTPSIASGPSLGTWTCRAATSSAARPLG